MKKSKCAKTLMTLLLALSLAFSLALAPVTVLAAPPSPRTVDQLIQDLDSAITRGEFAMLLNACLELPELEGAGFTDVPENHPYATHIMTAQAIGYMNGDGNGIFRPDDVISGAEASVCVNFFLGFDLSKVELNTQTTVPPWARAAVSNLLDLRMATLDMTDKKALSAADAIDFATALMIAVMFQGSPYELTQADENDDFYAYNNRQYLATATLAPGYIYAMSFFDPQFYVYDQTSALLEGILASGGAPGSDEWKICELYEMYMDEESRAESLEKVIPYIDEIIAVESIDELNTLAAKYYPALKLQDFYGLGVAGDAITDNTQWCVIALPGSFLLGARDYYDDAAELAPIHDALRQYIAAVLSYVGETGDLESRAQALFAVEQGNALASMPLEQLNDPNVIYTESGWDELDEIATGSNTMNYSPEIREILKDVNVYCPDMDYIKHIESLYTEENLDVLKDYAIINVMLSLGAFIGDDFDALDDELEAALFGAAPETLSLESRAQIVVTSLMSAAFSKLYADEYISSEVKADVTQIVGLIRDKYRERIAALDWMSDETKQMAIEKLDAIKAYVAYPDSYEAGFSFDVASRADGGDLIDFYFSYYDSAYAYNLEAYKKLNEFKLWDNVPTYTVNAYYSATENAIIIPGGILQASMYSKDAAREANLGAIGAIIAHEFTHAFDNTGAQFDMNGTITNWWTEADYAAFGELTGSVAAALSEIEFMSGQTVNGVLCTGETIADLGAMSCILDIADDMPDADMALVMRSWAGVWAARMSPEVAAYFLTVDTHAPNKVRTNFVLSQQDVFYETFGVTESDGMYIAPEYRISIW